MAEKNSEQRMWFDPKDYGLPYVEVKPLHNPKSEATKNLDSESKEKKGLSLNIGSSRWE